MIEPRETSPARIEPWGPGNLPLLQQTLGDPEMTKHLGGPETAKKLADRQARYEQPGSRQYRIVDQATGEGIGWVGYWERRGAGKKSTRSDGP